MSDSSIGSHNWHAPILGPDTKTNLNFWTVQVPKSSSGKNLQKRPAQSKPPSRFLTLEHWIGSSKEI